jgi:radical SAM protein with 4Fe4S-binding SPASM domain
MRTFGFQWHLTDRCNLRCSHCYQDAFSSGSERGLEDLRRMADRIFGALPDRSISINLTGGEPLVLRHLFDLMDHLHTFPNLEEIHLITNGTKTSDQVLERLRAQPKLGTIKVSLESAEAATNDAIRGEGNLDRVRRGIERLLTTGKPVVLMVTLSRVNAAAIEPTLDLACSLGASGVIFERFVPLGRGREMAEAVLDARGWRDAVLHIARASGIEADPEDLLAYRAFWLEPSSLDSELRGALCNLGDESMALMPDGTVYPCRRLPLLQGNILTEPFGVILDRLKRFGVEALRPRLRGQLCGACGVEDCAGCRALVRALTCDLFGDDPQCLLGLGGALEAEEL